jgi:hypothetical protein
MTTRALLQSMEDSNLLNLLTALRKAHNNQEPIHGQDGILYARGKREALKRGLNPNDDR